MGSCRTAGVSLCPKPGFRYFDFTAPSENGVHGTAIDPWGSHISVASVLWYAYIGSKYRNPGFGHSETPAVRHEPIYLLVFSVTLWLRGAKVLSLVGASDLLAATPEPAGSTSPTFPSSRAWRIYRR